MALLMKKDTAPCPIEKVVDLLGDNCSILIVRDLLEGPKRFSELECSLSGSTRTLAKKLKHLEKEGLVNRKKLAPSSTYEAYQLTKKGAAFEKVADAMRLYGKKYL